MPLSRPPGLPAALRDRFEPAPVGPQDAPALLALVSACDTAVLGYPDVSLEDIEANIADPAVGPPRQQALVRSVVDGRVVSWWSTDPQPGQSPGLRRRVRRPCPRRT